MNNIIKRIIPAIIGFALLISASSPVSADTAPAPAPSGTRLLPACVSRADGDLWGFIDETGAFVIQPAYVYVSDFTGNGAAIAMKGKFLYENCDVCFIDQSGKVISGPFGPYSSYSLPAFLNGYAVISGKNGSVVVGEDGKVVLRSPNTLYSYQEGMLMYSVGSGDGTLYGFMDLSGKVVIPAKYRYAGDFNNGRASVTLSDGNYALIDKTGKIVIKSNRYISSYQNSDSLIPFSVDMGNYRYLYGYQDSTGKTVIPAIYSNAKGFSNGFAIVSVTPEGDYKDYYGLIDETGKYVIRPEYAGINDLGEGLYAVSSNFYSYNYDQFAPKAIFNNKGEKLTDFVYYTVNPFINHQASATDELTTFFIGTDGKMLTNLPKLEGIGKLTMTGNIIKAEVDSGLSYLKTDGSVIWTKDETVSLSGGVSIKIRKYRPDFCTFVEYPEVMGLRDSAVQNAINAKLKSSFTDGLNSAKTPDGDNGENIYTSSLETSFYVQLNKNLLIIEESGYLYPIGAAHGMPSREYYYIDLNTGAFYGITDLFTKGSKYLDRLTSLVDRQIALNIRTNAILDNYYYFDEKPVVTTVHGFVINPDCLTVYFAPYEIAAYAAGFPEFDIPYGQLSDLIDMKGAFWNSFDKTVSNSKTHVIGDSIGDSVLTAIAGLMKSYETTMIDAISKNNFTLVEPCLLKGSSLSDAQKKLVPYLYNKGIREKLVSYDIYAVEYDNASGEYKVFTNETVAVKYPGKNYVNNQYSWCYTAKYDAGSKTWKLTKIERW